MPLDPTAPVLIHGSSSKVSGEFVGPSAFDLKFSTEKQVVDPFFLNRVFSPGERASLVDGIGFDVPDPIEVPASVITVAASDGQITSGQPGFVARDTSGAEVHKLVLDFISEALGRGPNRWSTDTYLQIARFEELGTHFRGEKLVTGYRSTAPLSKSGATIFWIDVNLGYLRAIETGAKIEVPRTFDFTPGFEERETFRKYAEIIFTYPDDGPAGKRQGSY